MKYFVLYLLILTAFAAVGSGKNKKSLDVLKEQYKDDALIISKLRNFEENGYGKHLNTGKLKPRKLISEARNFSGTIHCMGGYSGECMDCSGLLVAVFNLYDLKIPHNSQEQARYGDILTKKEKLKKGDLVFFTQTYSTPNLITHVGIYLGKNSFIHVSTKKGVTISELEGNKYWEEKFIFGTRIF